MSKLATFQQAKKLKELGYKDNVRFIYTPYITPEGKIHNIEDGYEHYRELDHDWNSDRTDRCSAPSISEALEWFREVKGVECEVCLRLCFMGDTGDATFGGYEYIVFDHNTNKTISSTIYHNRNEAESALLDALIEYVSK